MPPLTHDSLTTTSTPVMSELKDDQNHILTHGYVHGHVHQHDDHMHIHGHIHNHDHVSQLQKLYLPNSAAGCKELDAYDVCSDIFCEELDDCYFYDCEKVQDQADGCLKLHCSLPCEVASDSECCDDPNCIEEDDKACKAPEYLEHGHRGNSLCDLQKPKLSIFEDLIQNVHKTIEELLVDTLPSVTEDVVKRRRLNDEAGSNFRIHFPHHCHLSQEKEQENGQLAEPEMVLGKQQTPVLPSSRLPSHSVHQSCFHAKVPHASVKAGNLDSRQPSQQQQQSDFDFFIQFNNFNQFLDENSHKLVADEAFDNLLLFQLPEHPLAYACKWEKCLKKVDDSNLVSHVVDAHLKSEYQLENMQLAQVAQPAFECEWDNCNYVDEDFSLFLNHLNTHKSSINDKPTPFTKREPEVLQGVLPLLTPASTNPSTESPLQQAKPEEISSHNGLNITSMKICPKASQAETPFDPQFTCKWQIGTDVMGEPITCNKTHSCEGELQHHLQDEHIGLGKSVYQCCWLGCERNGGKPFVQRQKLFRHIHIHTHYKPCECKLCGSKFAVPAMLKQHMRTHSGEKPFECSICGKKFTTSSSLSIHNRVHSGERPLECKWPGCGKRFSESSNLAKHMRVHTKTFCCEICGEVFDKKTAYTKHRKDHTRNALELQSSALTRVRT